jgi:hypothetical protein
MERKKEMLTEVERRRVHVPEEAKVGAKVVGDELSASAVGICGRSSKFRKYAENGQTPDNGHRKFQIRDFLDTMMIFTLSPSRNSAASKYTR